MSWGLTEIEEMQFKDYLEYFGDYLGEKYDITLGVPDMETVLEIVRDSGSIDDDNQVAIDIYLAVSTPSDIDVFNEKLENTVSSESILTNVAQWKKDTELQQSQKVERQIQLMKEIEEFENLLEDDVDDFEASFEYDEYEAYLEEDDEEDYGGIENDE